jgi:hypothetical protein
MCPAWMSGAMVVWAIAGLLLVVLLVVVIVKLLQRR